ncbi:MAG: type II toxin-antitoxin system HicA family toxin [Elusimicrobia bacterium]|nr:type II toxin-antitoxin system HicA family toxin [Elusimicrobiota bacterium]
MSKLPQISGERVIRALKKAHFIVLVQRGSHVNMRHADDLSRRCTVVIHGSRPVKPGTLHAILKGAKITLEEFIELL